MGGTEGHGGARIVIAGGHPVIRGVVRLSCASMPGMVVVAETETAAEVADVCDRERPDLLVLDRELADADGLEALEAMRERGLDTPVLILTDRTDGPAVLEALKLDVRGYVTRTHGLRSIGDSVRRVVAGERLIAPELEQAAVMALGLFARQAREGSEVRAVLTPREQEILVMVSRGFTMHQVGTRLGISPRTVETHVAKLYRKLGVRTRVQAVSRAAQLGLIDLR